LVNDTLDYYQIKSGKFTQKLSPFAIRDVVEGCFDLISLQLEQKQLTKIIEIDPYLDCIRVVADKERLSQVFVNLLSNALKFTFKGYIKIKVENEIMNNSIEPNPPLSSASEQRRGLLQHYDSIDIEEAAQDAQKQDTVTIKVSVEDSGLGIKDEDKDKLFKMFGKLKQDREDINPHGIGLGLTICNSVLSQLGG